MRPTLPPMYIAAGIARWGHWLGGEFIPAPTSPSRRSNMQWDDTSAFSSINLHSTRPPHTDIARIGSNGITDDRLTCIECLYKKEIRPRLACPTQGAAALQIPSSSFPLPSLRPSRRYWPTILDNNHSKWRKHHCKRQAWAHPPMLFPQLSQHPA